MTKVFLHAQTENGLDGWQEVRADASTWSLQTIEYEHHEIHSGSSYTCHYNNDCTNIGEMTVIAFNTPDTTKWAHVIAEVSATAAAYFAIYEATSIDVGEGTALSIYNHNRNSTKTSTVSTIEATPVANKATSFNEGQAAAANITTTTELMRVYIGAGEKVTAAGGGTRGAAEFVLKQDTQYAFMIVSTTADDNTHSILLNYYEHTDKS